MNYENNVIKFENPHEMLLVCDDNLLDGHLSLHPWQDKILREFAEPSTSDEPYKAVVRAANGSGKDNFIVAPCAVWLSLRYENSLTVITSASGNQLDRQTDKYIKQLTNAQNKIFGTQIWKQNYRRYENLINGSTIEMFVTDEAGRAEGWHPPVPGGQMAILVSEAKSIHDDIFTALARCTGFTKRIDVSSPGLPSGHFYNACVGGSWRHHHITAFDCPHLSEDYISDIRNTYGENSALYRSMVLADFGGLEEQVVINFSAIAELDSMEIEHAPDNYNIAGLDLSAGGDEQVVVVRNGNKVIGVEAFKYADTTVLLDKLGEVFYKYDLDNPNSVIYGDAGGLGKPILDQLRRDGWPVNYVLNQAAPYNKLAYLNRGAELWFSVGKHIENCEIILPKDTTLRKQLASRYYTITPQNKIQLESKRQAKAKGHASPDRADAFVLAFADYRGVMPQRYVSRDVVQYELNEISEPEPERHSSLRARLQRPRETHKRFKSTGWSDEIIYEVEQMNQRLLENANN
jgi:hypothetical protein